MMYIEEPVNPKILPKSFFMRNNTELIAKELLGKLLITNINGEGLTGGIIAETEAYLGIEDKACHAYGGRRTKRNEALYMEGGTVYVYICYGMHKMFNISTNAEGIPHAILIRGIIPVKGIEIMKKRRSISASSGDEDKILIPKNHKNPASGPGNLTKALGIEMKHNKMPICGDEGFNLEIYVADVGFKTSGKNIIASPRIGVNYAEEWAQKPLRFCLKITESGI